jgi:hypothetical protein
MTVKALYPNLRPSLLLDFANTKDLDPRITFTRTTTARYYDGKTTAKAEENLLLRSQEFENSYWTKADGTISANAAVAPDGTSTADKLIENVSVSFWPRADSALQPVPSGFTYTGTVFAKADGRNWLVLSFGSAPFGGAVRAWFDLSTGTVGSTVGSPTTSIQSVGNGWYRCSMSQTTTAAQNTLLSVGLSNADGNALGYTGDGTSGIYIWGAQLEQRSSVTAYTPTTTQPVTNYIPALQTAAAGQARFDHNPVTGESLGLLIEEQRSNLLQRSEEFDNAYWTKTRSSITANTIIAPDGTLTADKLVENTDNNTHFVRRDFTGTAASYTASVYAKAGERTSFDIWLYNGSVYVSTVTFNLVDGTAGAGGTITSVGNGWYRCSVSGTMTTSASCSVRIFLSDGTSATYTGDGYSGIYIWGAQLEAGAFPTSYIKTEGSSVTRNADAASMTGANFSSWYRADEGTLYGEGVGRREQGALATINEGSDFNNMIILGTLPPANAFRMWANGAGQVDIGGIVAGVINKTSFAYATNNSAASINGSILTDTTCIVPSVGITTFQIGRGFGGTAYLCGTLKKLAYYPARLTNAQLQALTAS